MRTAEPLRDEAEEALADATPAGTVGLLLGLRSGFTTRPRLPFTTEFTGSVHAAEHDWLDFVVSGQPTPRAPGPIGAAFRPINPDAWSSTETGLGWVYRTIGRRKRLIVLGDTVDDFALAMTLDRMGGHSSTSWIPDQLLAAAESREIVGNCLVSASLDLERDAGVLEATSATLALNEVRSKVESALADARVVVNDDRPTIKYIDASRLRFQPMHYLAFVPDAFDLRVTLPTSTGSDGSIAIAAKIPAQVPQSIDAKPGMRPYWQVDVDLRPRSAPAGRGLPGERLLVRETTGR